MNSQEFLILKNIFNPPPFDRSHDTLLSDEEAQEVAHLLSPSADTANKPIEERWTQDSPIVVEEDISLQRYIYFLVQVNSSKTRI